MFITAFKPCFAHKSDKYSWVMRRLHSEPCTESCRIDPTKIKKSGGLWKP